jgi:uncharacterized protein (TIGR00290 family)
MSNDAVALLSGGKDSTYAAWLGKNRFGLNVRCLAHIGAVAVTSTLSSQPDAPLAVDHVDPKAVEVDSYIYQSVASEAVPLLAVAFGKPLYILPNAPSTPESHREQLGGDMMKEGEVWRLYRLLCRVIADFPSIKYVISGAIASNYQRVRVERVCRVLGLVSVAPLWYRDQVDLLHEMTSPDSALDAILVKVCSIGLDESHLGQTLRSMKPTLLKLHSRFGVHPCGEGGEFESFTLDSADFEQYRLSMDASQTQTICHDAAASVYYLYFNRASLRLQNKQTNDVVSVQWSFKEHSQAQSVSHSPIATWPPPPAVAAALVRSTHIPIVAGCPIDGAPVIVLAVDDELEDVARTQLSTPSIEYPGQLATESNPPKTDTPFPRCWGRMDSSGVFSFSVAVEGPSVTACIHDAFASLKIQLLKWNASIDDLCFSSIWLNDMTAFSEMNAVYNLYVSQCREAPSRCCISVKCGPLSPPSSPSAVQICFFGGATRPKPRSLHVESISAWAPACIGPYSQSHKLDGLYFIAGQIPLVPATMRLLGTGMRDSALLCEQHVKSVMRSQISFDTAVPFHSRLFYTQPDPSIESMSKDFLSDYPWIQVSELPRAAPCELVSTWFQDDEQVTSALWQPSTLGFVRQLRHKNLPFVLEEMVFTQLPDLTSCLTAESVMFVEIYCASDNYSHFLTLASNNRIPHQIATTSQVYLCGQRFSSFFAVWKSKI